RHIIKQYNLDVINSQYPGLQSLNFVLMRHIGIFRGKNIFTFQGTDVRAVLSAQGLLRKIWKWMLRRVDLLVFVSQGLKNEFLAFDPALAGRCAVVHNGVDVDAFKQRSDQGLPPLKFFEGSVDLILSIGKFEYRKG